VPILDLPIPSRRVSKNVFLSYRAGGKEIVVSAKTTDEVDAKRELEAPNAKPRERERAA
jgi:hypothetical protein